MKPISFSRIVDGRKYDTATAALLAHDRYWDGNSFERHGRNQFLYRTPNGAYFYVVRSLWQGESDTLEPVSAAAAMQLYEFLQEHEVEYLDAFPGANVVDA